MAGNFDIDRIAELARIKLSESEKDRLGKHLATIIEYIDHLDTLDTTDVEPTSHVLAIQNVFRKDELKPSPPEKDYLKLAPASVKGHYEVPQII